MSKTINLVILSPLLIGTVGFGQSVNIDFGPPASTKPSATYGAGAGQPGYWNHIVASGNHSLLELDGTAVAGSIFVDSMGKSQAEIPGASGGDEALMESMMWTGASQTRDITISALSAGAYDLFIYAWGSPWSNTGGVSDFNVTLHDGTGSGFYRLDFELSAWPGTHIQDETYLRIPITMAPNASTDQTKLIVSLPGGSGENGIEIIQGIQLVKVPAPSVPAAAMLATAWAFRRRR